MAVTTEGVWVGMELPVLNRAVGVPVAMGCANGICSKGGVDASGRLQAETRRSNKEPTMKDFDMGFPTGMNFQKVVDTILGVLPGSIRGFRLRNCAPVYARAKLVAIDFFQQIAPHILP